MNKGLLLLVILAFILMPLGLYAAGHDSLVPLLVDLPGWSAEKAEGMDMSSGGMRAITVARSYERGEQRIGATILVGMQAGSMWAPNYTEGFKMETTEAFIEVKKIEGFPVFYSYEKESSSGGIMVQLQDSQQKAGFGAVLVLEYEGLKLEEALKIARTFNWSKMKAEVAKLK